jgi:DNA polymerase III epsilon subunit-like protein
MANYLAIDTETTGLPKTRAAPTKDNTRGWDTCRPLSIAIIEFENNTKISTVYHLVYPDQFEVAATEIHGITEEDAKTNGRPFEEVYDCFVTAATKCPRVVGHNLKFDLDVLKSEAIRRDMNTSIFDTIEPLCTLKMAKQIYLKPMKLVILYELLFGKPLDGAHNAEADAVAAGEVYARLTADPRTYSPIKAKKVVIKASDVAACICLHPYKSACEVLDDMWKKYTPDTFKGETRDDRNMRALESSSEAQRLLKAVLSLQPKDSTDVQSLVDTSVDIIKKDDKLSNAQKSMVCDHIRKMIYTNHGIRSEDTTADLDESELHKDETFYTHPVITIEGTQYEIVGRIDRYQLLEDGTKTLVEIKNRTKALFCKVRVYEMIQVQTYLQMTGMVSARLIEQHNQVRMSYLIEKDSESWTDTIIPKLTEFCKTLHHNMSS